MKDQVFWQGTHAGAVIPEGVYPVERIHYGAVCGELQPVGRTHNGEFQKQRVMNGLHLPFHILPMTLWC